MTPEKAHFQENLWLNQNTPEQLEKLKNDLKAKVDTLKADGSFSGEDLADLVDLLDDKTILSPTEAELKSHLETLQNLETQIDFLMALVEVGGEENKRIIENEIWWETVENISTESTHKVETFYKVKIDGKEITFKNIEKNSKENFEKILELYNTSKKFTFYENNTAKEKNNELNNFLLNIQNKSEITKIDVYEAEVLSLNLYKIASNQSEKNFKEFNDLKWIEDIDVEDYNLNFQTGLKMLIYTNINFKELSTKTIRIWQDKISWLDSESEVLRFQKKLIERLKKISKNEANNYDFIYEQWKWYTFKEKPKDQQISNQETSTTETTAENETENIDEIYETFLKELEDTNLIKQQILEIWNQIGLKNNNKNKNLKINTKNERIQSIMEKENPTQEDLKEMKIFLLNEKLLNAKKLTKSEISLLLSNKNNDKNNLKNISEYLEKNNIELDLRLVYPKNIGYFLKIQNIKVLPISYLGLPINQEFIKFQNNSILPIFQRILDNIPKEDQKGYFDNIIQKIYAESSPWNTINTEEIFTLINSNDILKNSYNARNFSRFKGSLPEVIQNLYALWDNLPKQINEAKDYESLKNLFKEIPNFVKNNWSILNSLLKKVDKLNIVNEFKISDFYSLQNNIDFNYYFLIKTGTIIDEKWNIQNKYLKPDEIDTIKIFNRRSLGSPIITNMQDDKISPDDVRKSLKLYYNINEINNSNIGVTEVSNIKNILSNKKLETTQMESLKTGLSQILEKHSIDNKHLDEIFKILSDIENKNDLTSIPQEIGQIIYWENFKNNLEEISTLLKDIYNSLDNFFNQKIKNLSDSLVKNHWIDEKKLSEIKSEIEKYITENTKPEKKVEIIKRILKAKLNITEKNQDIENIFFEIYWLNTLAKEAKLAANNTEAYIKFALSWESGPFEDYAARNKIALKNEFWEIINADKIKNIWDGFTYKDWLIFNQNYAIDTEKWLLKFPSWNVELSQTEQNMIKSNPETAKNIINLYSSLERVWLSKLWNFRENIFKSIENISNWRFTRQDWDYFNETETKILLNSILVSIWEKPINQSLNMEAFLSRIEEANGRDITWTEKQINWHKDTKLENLFIEKFIPRWDVLWFKQSSFENSLKKIN